LVDFDQLRTDVESESTWSKSHRFLYLQVEKDSNGKYLFNEHPTLIIQTRYLADLIAGKYVDELLKLTNNSFDLQHASVHGILFERVALRLIGEKANRCVFHFLRLTSRCQFPPLFQPKKKVLQMPETLTAKYFDAGEFEETIDPISGNVLAIPHSDYFPGFDASLSFLHQGKKYLALLQMTTASEHPLSPKGLELLVRAHNSKLFTKIIIIYVLPSKNALGYFGLQKLLHGTGSTEVSKAIFNKTSQVAVSIATIKGVGETSKRAKIG